MSDSVAEIAVPGGWTEQSLTIADHRFDLVLPANPDAFLEALAELPHEEHDKHDIYWARLWQAAPPTAERVLKHPWPRGEKALEFGCGIGLVGLAALARGLELTFSDYEPMALRTALENARRNGFEARGAVLDWRYPPQERYRFLFGCDVLYNQQMHEPLVGFIDAMLADDGLCWIGDAGRFHAGKFLELAERRGFKTRIEDEAGRTLPAAHHGKFQLFVLERRSREKHNEPRIPRGDARLEKTQTPFERLG